MTFCETIKSDMIRKVLHIFVIAILALNLMGAWAFASALDCGMECCEQSETAQSGIPTYEAPSCCALNNVTCGVESSQYEELFDTAICCYTGADKVSAEWDLNVFSGIFSPSLTLPFPYSERSTSPPKSTPLYLSNASLLC